MEGRHFKNISIVAPLNTTEMATDKGTSLMKDLLSYVVFRIDFFPLQNVYSKMLKLYFFTERDHS